MKKIFLLALSLPFLICGGFYYDGQRFKNDVQQWGSDMADNLHTLVERDHENYWLNNIRSFKTYPINYYHGSHENLNETTVQTSVEHTQEYPRNIPVSANVGQRMVGDEIYTLTTSAIGEHYEMNNDGYILNSVYRMSFNKGQVMTPLGDVLINGRWFIIFEPERDGRMLLADENGQIMHNIAHYYRGELLMSRDATTIMPKDLSIIKTTNPHQTASASQMVYEIIYKGLTENHMEFTYVDFSNGRSEKTFAFPLDQQIVTMNGKSLKILKATADNIQYIILN